METATLTSLMFSAMSEGRGRKERKRCGDWQIIQMSSFEMISYVKNTEEFPTTE